jgi:hypothetical protein
MTARALFAPVSCGTLGADQAEAHASRAAFDLDPVFSAQIFTAEDPE